MFKRPQLQKYFNQSYSFCVLHVVSWCFTFARNFIISRKVFDLQSRHKYKVEMAMFNVKMVITPKVGKPELLFMCSASRLIVLYICVKLSENIDRTRVHSRNGYFQYLLCSKDSNSKSRLTSVMVFLFCILSHCALHL